MATDSARRPIFRGGRRGPAFKALNFVKEWGGVATLVVALLYTFPFAIIDRWVNAASFQKQLASQSLAAARQALSDVTELRAQKLDMQVKSTDLTYLSAVDQAFDIRIYNATYTNLDLFEQNIAGLRDSELYAIGSAFTLIGLPANALKFFDAAIGKAQANGNTDTVGTILRERGWTLFTPGPSQDIKRARADYVEAIRIRASAPFPGPYLALLFELAGFELMNGDWQCGHDLGTQALAIFRPYANQFPQGVPVYVTGYYNLSQRPPAPTQPKQGCGYSVAPLAIAAGIAPSNFPASAL